MFKHYIGVILLGITGVIVIIIGIILVGSPSDQQLLRFDEIRLKDFENIQPPIENFYSDNKKLPQSLTALNTTLTFKDPQSKKDYTYKTISPTSYQLCAEFSTDSKEVAQRQTGTNPYAYNSYGSATKLHKKGYDCIKYQISSYLIQNLNNYPPTTPTISSQQNYFQFLKPIPHQTL